MSRKATKPKAAKADVRRCAIYTRKSTARGLEQEFNTLDAQYEACANYVARQEGWEISTERYDDGGFTGANLERPAFQRLEADIQAGKIDIVVVYKVDRLSRSLLDFAKVMDRFNQAGTAFVSVTQNFSTADAMGRLTLNMLMSFAEFEREMIAERTKDKIAAARRKGKWTGGTVPIGYKAIDKKLIIDEVEAPIVREIFDLYEQHRSALAVAKLLNEHKRRTKRHRAQNKNVKESRPWSKDAVLRVVKNPVYAGLMPYGDERHEGEHDGIIDRDRFHRIQVLLKDHQGRSLKLGRNPDYILRGVIRCDICGKAMTPASTRKKGREYRYYRCVTRDKLGKDACAARPLSAEAIEEFVVDKIRVATSDGSFAADVTAQLENRVITRREHLLDEQRGIPRELAKLKSEGRKLAESMADQEGAARRLIDERIAETECQLATHEVRLAEIQRMLDELGAKEVEGRWVTATLAHFDKVWEALNVLNQARLVRAIVEEVLIHEQKGTVEVVLADIHIGEDKALHENTAPEPPAPHEPAQVEACA